MASILKVDQLKTTTGSGFIIPPAGSIVQIQYNQLTTPAVSQSFTAYDYDVVNNFPTVSITPIATSSKVKVDVQWFGEMSVDTQQHNHMFLLYRNSTALRYSGTAHDSTYRGIAPSSITYAQDNANNSSTPNILYMTYFDEPNTTDAITYKLGAVFGADSIVYINRTVADNNAANYERGTSFISATEIAG